MKRIKLHIPKHFSVVEAARPLLICGAFVAYAVLLLWIASNANPAFANGGDDHDHARSQATGASSRNAATVSVRTAERNITTPDGTFRARLRHTPTDPRAGEVVNTEVELTEKVEGGFGGGDQPVKGTVTAQVTTASGTPVASGIETHAEGDPPRPGVYGVHYAFPEGGDYKFVFNVRTEDGRAFDVDFPMSVVAAPINWAFWLGIVALGLVSFGAIFGYYRSWRNEESEVYGERVSASTAWRKTLPIAAAALVFFGVGTAALAYFAPPRERRASAALPPATGESASAIPLTGDPSLGGAGALVTISKESQLLFGIRTTPVEQRQIVSGLKTTSTVRVRPDARAVITPPVSGRITFNRNVGLGAAVGRGQQIGSVEQILGAPEQAGLEAQRIGLRTAALEQRARATEQQSLAAQARTRLTQAQRELQRARNLLEVGAAPRRRVEEAETAVSLAKQEVASAEQQTRVAQQQVRLSNESVARVNPVRTFPLIAPVTGIIGDIRATTGQQAEAGTELMSIVNLTSVFLEAQVFEGNLAAVRESGRASYTSPALDSDVYRIGQGGEGRLVSIGQTVDPQTRTIPVIFEVPNPLNRLREGMFVEITLNTSGGAQVFTVPKRAVITEQGRTFVFVLRGGEQFERRVVTLGAEGQEYYQVNSGLQAGERVVVEGIYQLRSTQPG